MGSVMKLAGLALLVLLVLALLFVYAGASGWLGSDEEPGEVHAGRRPAATVEESASVQGEAAQLLGASPAKQILFGDFHVHTTFSFDAFLQNLPIAGGVGSTPPADACDFARFCSALDFWSINDHAEALTADLWRKTIDSVRQCNAVSGDPADPDLVTYLGWEWSHIGTNPDNHYGHKNVVFRGLDDDEIPTRPIASRPPNVVDSQDTFPFYMRAALATFGGERGRSFIRLAQRAANADTCPDGVPVRDLPADCLESAPTPEVLFEKLDDWGHDSIVIPHGTTWGLYTPAGSDWRKQLPGHDPARQTLLELYSGHGNSERLPSWRPVEVNADGSLSCPEPKDGYLPSCWHAGELIEARCLEVGESDAECARRAEEARANYVAAFQGGPKTLPGYDATAWLDAGQAPRDWFQPAFNYRPRGSGQYMLAIRDFSDPARPKGFEFGFIGSSDNHTARGGTGYKEFARGFMTEGRGRQGDDDGASTNPFVPDGPDEPASASVPWDGSDRSPLALFEMERGAAYFVTGGLVAVHSPGRDRSSIWSALGRKEVYATSGRRTLLWFDLIDGAGIAPMGSKVTRGDTPRFRVRAMGSFEQKPGCPQHVVDALGQEQVDRLCLAECYNPSDTRRPITRIEVVRVRPQIFEDEPVADLVDDPWRVLPCPAEGTGCVVEFADPEFADSGRDAVYYVRAIEAPDLLINGENPLQCRYDEQGRCVEITPCGRSWPAADDCLGEAEPRAWSSPIFLEHADS
jgi:hypothetical protein